MQNRTPRRQAANPSGRADHLSSREAAPATVNQGVISAGEGLHREEDVESSPIKWSQERRLRFIDFRLQWGGRINRRDLVDFFKISVPQASADIARYTDLAPGNLAYDTSSRIYVAQLGFAPCYESSGARQYLSQLLALERQILSTDQAFLAFRPPMASVPLPNRTVASQTLALVLQAIAERAKLHVKYQSIARDEPQERFISPHAFGYDGVRWHVRAFCHLRKRFKDFILGRLQSPGLPAASEIDSMDDHEWHTNVELILRPDASLSPIQRESVEIDYGMKDGSVSVPCRQAMLFYALRTLNFEANGSPRKGEKQVVIANLAAIKPFLSKPGQI